MGVVARGATTAGVCRLLSLDELLALPAVCADLRVRTLRPQFRAAMARALCTELLRRPATPTARLLEVSCVCAELEAHYRHTHCITKLQQMA